jgi:hypothetical protein
MATGTEVIPLQQLLQEDIIGFLGASGDASAKASKNAKAASSKTSEISKIYEEVAKSAATIEYQKGTAELQVQQNTRKAALAAGIQVDQGAGIILELMDRLNKNNADIIKQVDEVKALDASTANIIENPIRYIGERIQSASAKKSIQQNAGISKLLSDQLGVINAGVQQSAQTYRALAEPVTQGVIEARTKISAAEAMIRSRQLEIEGIKYDTESVNVLLQANKQQIDALHMLKGSKDSDVRLQLSLDSASQQREQWEWNKAQDQIAKVARETKTSVDDSTLEYINISRRVGGVPELSKNEYANFAKLDDKQSDLKYHLKNGMQIVATGRKALASNPAEALEAVREHELNVPEAQQQTLLLIQEAERIAKATPRDPKDTRGLKDAINKQTNEFIKQQYGAIKQGSIFDVGELKPYLQSSPELASLPVTKKIFEPAIAAGQPLNDTKVILGLGIEAVKRGNLTSSEFLGLSDIYRRASQINAVSRGFLKNGIVVPDNGAKYQVRIGGMFNSKTIDMNDPVSLSTYLAGQLVPAGSSGIGQDPTLGIAP